MTPEEFRRQPIDILLVLICLDAPGAASSLFSSVSPEVKWRLEREVNILATGLKRQ